MFSWLKSEIFIFENRNLPFSTNTNLLSPWREASLQGDNKLVFVENGKLRFSKINISDFSHENISNEKLVVSDSESNEEILKSVLNGSGQNPHKYVVALNAALVLWTAGIEDDLHEGFNKALFSINQGNPWEKFLLLRTYLASDE